MYPVPGTPPELRPCPRNSAPELPLVGRFLDYGVDQGNNSNEEQNHYD